MRVFMYGFSKGLTKGLLIVLSRSGLAAKHLCFLPHPLINAAVCLWFHFLPPGFGCCAHVLLHHFFVTL